MATLRKQFITKTDALIHVPSDDSSGGCVPQTNRSILYEIWSVVTRLFSKNNNSEFLQNWKIQNDPGHRNRHRCGFVHFIAIVKYCISIQKSIYHRFRQAKSSHSTHCKVHKLAHSWFTFMLQSEVKENFHNKFFPSHTDKLVHTCESLLVPPHAPSIDVPNNGAWDE